MNKNRCHARTKKGRACSVGAVKGTKFCLLHTVDESTGLTQAQIIGRWGGTRRTLTISRKEKTKTGPFLPPTDVRDQARILAQLQVEVHQGICPTRVALTIATLANSYINALEVADFGEKLRDLEKRMGLESPIDRLEEEQVQ